MTQIPRFMMIVSFLSHDLHGLCGRAAASLLITAPRSPHAPTDPPPPPRRTHLDCTPVHSGSYRVKKKMSLSCRTPVLTGLKLRFRYIRFYWCQLLTKMKAENYGNLSSYHSNIVVSLSCPVQYIHRIYLFNAELIIPSTLYILYSTTFMFVPNVNDSLAGIIFRHKR